jgi:alanine dehydrogenase
VEIGIPKEIKPLEGRVALIPPAVGELVRAGHRVSIEAGAGAGSGYGDDDYRRAGAIVASDAIAVYRQAELIVKVKEPLAPEVERLGPGQILFSYLHLAANRTLAQALCTRGVSAVAFETVERNGLLPLLAPMSDIAGRLAVQIGAHLLHAPAGGRGVLLGGLPGTERGRVVILGGGVAGTNAAAVAAALGAEVTVFERTRERFERLHGLGPNVTARMSYAASIAEALIHADLVIGAVLIPGARAPRLVTRAMVQAMQSGAVIVDIAVDQGGCVETTRPTDYTAPTYFEEGVVHFAVTNMPGAVPRIASQALSASLLPYVQRLAVSGPADPGLGGGLNVQAGRVVHPAVAEALAKPA